MIDQTPQWLAEACGGSLVGGAGASAEGPNRAVVDTRAIAPGDLFVGLRGARVDGGEHAGDALERGAWGVLVERRHGESLRRSERPVIAVDDPLRALAALARAWRRSLGAQVVGITGSTGKTSTKDILKALLANRLRTHATHENLNTEIGLPLTILEASRGTECLVLEMAMRGAGQIAELAAIAEPDVGVIINVGPVHLELLGSVERVAAAKAELIAELRPGATAVLPANERLLEPFVRSDLETLTFGPGGDVELVEAGANRVRISLRGEPLELSVSFSEPHNLLNLLAAVAAAHALDVTPTGAVEARFSSLRGELIERADGVTVVNDCYNANPMSMKAALENLASNGTARRRLAVLGEMAELGPGSVRYHREIGQLADRLGVDVLITVGEGALPIAEAFDGERYAVGTPEEAGALLEELAVEGDRVLIKGSRSAGLERVLSAASAGETA